MMKTKRMLILIVLTFSLFLSVLAEASAEEALLEIEVTDFPLLVFDGDRVPVTVRLSNVGGQEATDVVLRSSTGEERTVGTLAPGIEREVTLYIENYERGTNEAEIYATFSGAQGESRHWSLRFEVRQPDESITLRVIDAPHSIYEGMVLTAQLEVQNLWQQAVSGTRIKSGQEVLYHLGALEPNQSLQIDLRIQQYEVGANRLELVADHERGTTPPVTLQFEVIPAESAVKAYLGSLSSPAYPSEDIELSIIIAASEDAEISELELKALTNGVEPTGYYLGQEVAAEEEVAVPDVQSLLLGPPEGEGEEETERAVKGRELSFQVKEADVGSQSLDFQISYRLGSALVQREFTVDALVLPAPSVHLIQAERIEVTKGKDALVTLHVANDLPVDVDAVSVVPLGSIEASPSEFFIGGMSPDDFLPAYFRIPTDNLENGDHLYFKAVYRVGRQTYETSPLCTVVYLEEAQGLSLAVYIVPPVVLVLLALLVWSLRRRRWTR